MNAARPAWWPTQEQKERADQACADAMARRAGRLICGQRAVLTQGRGYGYVSGSCAKAKDHSGREHRDADGNTWIESVR